MVQLCLFLGGACGYHMMVEATLFFKSSRPHLSAIPIICWSYGVGDLTVFSDWSRQSTFENSRILHDTVQMREQQNKKRHQGASKTFCHVIYNIQQWWNTNNQTHHIQFDTMMTWVKMHHNTRQAIHYNAQNILHFNFNREGATRTMSTHWRRTSDLTATHKIQASGINSHPPRSV